MNKRNHFLRQFRHTFEISRRSVICHSCTVYTKFRPCSTRSNRAKIRAAMFFASTNNSRRNSISLLYPRIKLFPSIFAHQFFQSFTYSRCFIRMTIRVFELSFYVITDTYDYDSRPQLGNPVIACIEQFYLNSIT